MGQRYETVTARYFWFRTTLGPRATSPLCRNCFKEGGLRCRVKQYGTQHLQPRQHLPVTRSTSCNQRMQKWSLTGPILFSMPKRCIKGPMHGWCKLEGCRARLPSQYGLDRFRATNVERHGGEVRTWLGTHSAMCSKLSRRDLCRMNLAVH